MTDFDSSSQSQPCGAHSGAATEAVTSAAHTPGPWRIEGRRGAGYIISAGVNSYGDGPEAYVGVLDPMFHIAGEKTAEHHANALLVASAPRMYAALRRIADAPAWGYPETWATTPTEVRRLAREAIAEVVAGQEVTAPDDGALAPHTLGTGGDNDRR